MNNSCGHGGKRDTNSRKSTPLPRPTLKTLDDKPSWVNRAGRIDRSACMELRASDIWREVPKDDWRPLPSPPGRGAGGEGVCHGDRRNRHHSSQRAAALTPPLSPWERENARSHCEAHADFTVTARGMFNLHNTRLPLQLAGDFRTRKSNAMRSHIRIDVAPFAANPNRGATRRKRLGLWSGREPCYAISPRTAGGWTQTVRIERWRVHDRLAQHFLICPRCGKKNMKLFMVLAWDQEMHDAQVAEGWIAMLDSLCASPLTSGAIRMDRRLLEFRAKLIDRYGLLFRDCGGRQLVCRQCLHVRYGEVKWNRLPSPEKQASERANRRAKHTAELAARFEAERSAELAQVRSVIPPERVHAQCETVLEMREEARKRERENEQRRRRAAQREATRQVEQDAH